MNMSIQGCRGFAILLVFSLHVYGAATTAGWMEPFSESSLRFRIMMGSAAGVEIFFIISGYLAVASIRKANGFSRYLVNRIIRVYPVFLVLHLLVFTMGPLIGYKWLKDISLIAYIFHFFTNLFLLPGVFKIPIAQPLAWALSYIMAFYLLWGMVFAAYTARHESRVSIIIFLIAAALSLVFIYYRPRAIFFLVGLAAYYTEPFIKKNFNTQMLSSFLAISCLAIMLMMLSISGYKNLMYIAVASLFGYVFSVLFITNDHFVKRIMNMRWLVNLGNISYSFFLIHTFVMFPMKAIFKNLDCLYAHQYLSISAFAGISFVASFLLSIVMYRYIETGFVRRYLEKKVSVWNQGKDGP
ncbi:MAG TPA: acyltransferase [Deltaproteobacteria bacterium]|nr:acyltransferase [Deltaproteobacteria bacterium]